MITIAQLPMLNAILNLSSTVLLIIGFVLIKQKRWKAHRIAMLAAAGMSAAFLVSYLIYHANIGSKPFLGTGTIRVVYFTILLTHTVLAVVNLPLVIITLRRGLGLMTESHRKIARITYPIWLYVSVTGVMIYLMLYQLSFS